MTRVARGQAVACTIHNAQIRLTRRRDLLFTVVQAFVVEFLGEVLLVEQKSTWA